MKIAGAPPRRIGQTSAGCLTRPSEPLQMRSVWGKKDPSPSGTESTCSIDSSFQLFCWGKQEQIFDNTTTSKLSPFLMNFDASVISYSDQDMDGDGISNNLDVHMPGDDDGDGVPSPNDPYPNNPARWMNCDLGSWGRIDCTESSAGHYSISVSYTHLTLPTKRIV